MSLFVIQVQNCASIAKHDQ